MSSRSPGLVAVLGGQWVADRPFFTPEHYAQTRNRPAAQPGIRGGQGRAVRRPGCTGATRITGSGAGPGGGAGQEGSPGSGGGPAGPGELGSQRGVIPVRVEPTWIRQHPGRRVPVTASPPA